MNEKIRLEFEKEWANFVEDIVETNRKFSRVTAQLSRTLAELKNAVNPHGLPYGYSDRK